jgi:hypothetical protein
MTRRRRLVIGALVGILVLIVVPVLVLRSVNGPPQVHPHRTSRAIYQVRHVARTQPQQKRAQARLAETAAARGRAAVASPSLPTVALPTHMGTATPVPH